MGFFKAFLCFFALLIFLPFLSVSSTVKQTYIVHMKHQDNPFPYATHHDWYSAQLRSLFDSDFSILYTYTDAFYGFAAKLDSDQAELLRRSDLVLGVYEDTLYPLLTTRTPEFLDLYTESSQNTQFLEQASRDVIGPNKVTPYILKPDVIGPGVNILAARPEAVVPTGLYTDTRKTQFNVISGSE